MNVFNYFIVKLGASYTIDNNIPKSYLLRIILSKTIDLVYGIIRFRKIRMCFVAPSTVIKHIGLLTFNHRILIAPNCYIDALGKDGIKCGKDVSIGRNTTIIVTGSLKNLGKGIIIGNNVGLGTHSFYGGAGGLEIGDDTICGNYVSIHPENHNYNDSEKPIRLQGVNHKGIKIGKGCWIGAKSTILDGTEIGEGCIVAAGAVVSGKFPENVIIGGVPAKIIKHRFS